MSDPQRPQDPAALCLCGHTWTLHDPAIDWSPTHGTDDNTWCEAPDCLCAKWEPASRASPLSAPATTDPAACVDCGVSIHDHQVDGERVVCPAPATTAPDPEPEECEVCHGTGTYDDPLSSAAGGRWFGYCHCPAGTRAADEDYKRNHPAPVPVEAAPSEARFEEMVEAFKRAAKYNPSGDVDKGRAAEGAARAALLTYESGLRKERDEAREKWDRQVNDCAFHRFDALIAVKALLDAFASGPTLNVTAAQGEAVESARDYVDEFGHVESVVTRERNAAIARAEAAESGSAGLRSRAEGAERDRDAAGERARALAVDCLAMERARDEERAARGRLVVLLKTAEMERDRAREALTDVEHLVSNAASSGVPPHMVPFVENVRRTARLALSPASDTATEGA